MTDSTFRIPIFPLNSPLFYPGRTLPLHVFEPRYRQLTEDALAGDGQFAMAVFLPGWENDYEGRPPIYSTICIGTITKHQRLPDGRFLLKLRGLERARVRAEEPGRMYRIGVVEAVRESPIPAHRDCEYKTELLTLLRELCGKTIVPPCDPDDDAPPPPRAIDIADETTLHLPVTVERKMQIFEIPDHAERVETVADCLKELKRLKHRCDDGSPQMPGVN
jgi:hypothetical protein